jgi:putative Holliday junction resolvase
MTGRVIAFDLGDRRIGVAVSDPTGTIAQPRETLERDGESWPWRAILAAIADSEATAVVVGNPLHLDGRESTRSEDAWGFARQLADRTALPVELQDERLTSVQSERTLKETGRRKGRRRDKGEVDRVAAVIILQTWLDTRSQRGSS